MTMSARIVEVEAYIGEYDPACHAAPGPTPRNKTLYGVPGLTYVYLIYGIYYCLNFVTEAKDCPAAVLIRAGEPVEGFEPIQNVGYSKSPVDRRLSGPGKLCREFGLSTAHTGIDLTGDVLYVEDRHEPAPIIVASPRIGITKATDRLWRFHDANSQAVSGKSLKAQS